MKYQNIREEELKNKIAKDLFWQYDTTRIIGNIDFCVGLIGDENQLFEKESLLWAEAKKGIADIYSSIAQLIITIGKARTFDRHNPPPFLGAFDAEKIAFIPYNEVIEIFYMNDFNWNVTPSDYSTSEFKLVLNRVKKVIDSNTLLFYYEKDPKDLARFIRQNFKVAKAGVSKIRIDKNNFMLIYNKWLEIVKPTIGIHWDIVKKNGIIDGDFYLADLLSENNKTLKEKLYVLLKSNHYELDRKIDDGGFESIKTARFTDDQKAHNQFWNKYERPPKEEYWDYIINRRDLLVPQDIRERKGSFFTPQKWVELSQVYIADALGEDWQDHYYVWDCAAGTGNLLAGLTNKYKVWASTLDKQDVDVMHDRIDNGANLLKSHVFQFDFLNDDFDKLPEELQKIINDPEKRKKLVIYINPPYAEGGSSKQKSGTGDYKKDVEKNLVHDKYHKLLSGANRELFAQFLIKIYYEINQCMIANFSTLKNLQSSHFSEFRNNYPAKLLKLFIVPADTFDNVKGKFPIGFFIWDTSKVQPFEHIECDVYDSKGEFIQRKNIYSYFDSIYISKWVNKSKLDSGFYLGWIEGSTRNSFQHNSIIFILNSKEQMSVPRGMSIYDKNLVASVVNFSVRHCIEATWLNDRDQFLYPNDGWQDDKEFHLDCLAFTLFHGQNRISSKEGTNHWIPFTEQEVDAKEKFESNFMTDFIAGKIEIEKSNDTLFSGVKEKAPSQREGGSEADGRGDDSNSIDKDNIKNTFRPSDTFLKEGTKTNRKSHKILPYNPNLNKLAKELRKNLTKAEVLLWSKLKGDALGVDFHRQKPILEYIVDFYSPEIMLAIEIDGSSHDFKGDLDQKRQEEIESLGVEFLRFDDSYVKQNLDGTLYVIEQKVKELKELRTPSASGTFLKEGTQEKAPSQREGGSEADGRGDESKGLEKDENKNTFRPSGTFLKEGTETDGRGDNPLQFSPEATAVFDAGRELWRYYHSQDFPRGEYNPNASLYDIREHFQGRNAKGRMNSRSDDENYTELIGDLRDKLKILAKKIEPKVYEYGFLKR